MPRRLFCDPSVVVHLLEGHPVDWQLLDRGIESVSRLSVSRQNLRNSIAVLAVLLTLGVVPAVAHNDGCSDATLKGDYGFTMSGFQPNPDGTTSPIRGVAITHFDGADKLTQRDFAVTAGVVVAGSGNSLTGFQFSTGETGTYKINADCTGSAEIDQNVPVPFGSTGVIKLVLVCLTVAGPIRLFLRSLIPVLQRPS